MKSVSLGAVCLLGLALSSCQKNHLDSTAAGNADPCRVLTAEEVASVQDAQVTAATGSSSVADGMLITQCVYTAAEANKSVVITITRTKPGGDKSKSALAYWENTFARFRNHEDAEEAVEGRSNESKESREREGEKEGPPPTPIADVGDEAFWSPNPMGGSIYALKKSRNAFIRVNIGGPGERAKKINSSKLLAQKAIKRL